MAPASDNALEAVGEGGVGCGEADGPDVAGKGDGAAELEERNVPHGALVGIFLVGNDLGHPADLGVSAEVIQLVGAQLDLVVFYLVVTAGRGVKAEQLTFWVPLCILVLSCDL